MECYDYFGTKKFIYCINVFINNERPNFKLTVNNLLIILCYSATMILFVTSTCSKCYIDSIHFSYLCRYTRSMEPILNPIWVLIVVGEKPEIYSIIGGIIVILAVIVRTGYVIKRQKLETNKFTENKVIILKY